MIRAVLLVLLVCGFFLGIGLALLSRCLICGAVVVAVNALAVLNGLFLVAIDVPNGGE